MSENGSESRQNGVGVCALKPRKRDAGRRLSLGSDGLILVTLPGAAPGGATCRVSVTDGRMKGCDVPGCLTVFKFVPHFGLKPNDPGGDAVPSRLRWRLLVSEH